ncbi:MAG: EAL domain-containing protein, partial [Rhodospirillales bacterium]
MWIGGADLADALGNIRPAPQLVTESELSEAITTGQLVVHYQPKATFGPAGVWHIEGAEALVRWRHPRCGLLMPNEFIRLAEMAGLISPLTDFVLRAALGQASRWHARGLPLSVAINLAPRLLSQLDLPDRLSRLVDEYGVDGSKLV